MDAYHYQTTCNPSQVGLIISREILIFREREFPKISRDFPGIPGKGGKWQFLLHKNSKTSHFREIMLYMTIYKVFVLR